MFIIQDIAQGKEILNQVKENFILKKKMVRTR